VGGVGVTAPEGIWERGVGLDGTDDDIAWVAGSGAGFLSGAFASWILLLSNFDQAGIALLLVLVLGTAVGVAYRTACVSVGLVVGLLVGMWIQGLMAPLPPAGEGMFSDSGDVLVQVAALLVALISYPIGLVCRRVRDGRAIVRRGIVAGLAALVVVSSSFVALALIVALISTYPISHVNRRLPDGRATARYGILAGLVALVVVSSSYVALAVWPADASYRIDTPSGWSTFRVNDTLAEIPEVGATYRAAQGDVGDFSLPVVPKVPMLGVSVLRQRLGDSGTYDDYNSYDCFRVADTWGLQSALYLGGGADMEAPLPGAYATVVTSSSGARYYAMAVSRTRWMSLTPERLCYLVVVTVPKDSNLGLAAVQSILSSFRLS
jgi:hypothetical protein